MNNTHRQRKSPALFAEKALEYEKNKDYFKAAENYKEAAAWSLGHGTANRYELKAQQMLDKAGLL